MDKLKENPFMAGIGGAVLLFLILAGVLIFPIWSDKGTLETKILASHQSWIILVDSMGFWVDSTRFSGILDESPPESIQNLSKSDNF